MLHDILKVSFKKIEYLYLVIEGSQREKEKSITPKVLFA